MNMLGNENLTMFVWVFFGWGECLFFYMGSGSCSALILQGACTAHKDCPAVHPLHAWRIPAGLHSHRGTNMGPPA